MTPRGAVAAAAIVGAVLTAAGIAAPMVIEHEGWLGRTYLDPIGVPTVCAGVTGAAAVKGRTYTDAQCIDMTVRALAAHGVDIAPCLPDDLPPASRAAFTAFAYNVGARRVCGSTLAARARAGDLAGACAELSRWTYAAGRELPGLKRRRAAERALCEQGLAETAARR